MVFEVEVCNWAKFNPRADVKSCSWFRMSNDFFSDPDFYECSIYDRIVWVYILSVASRKMTARIKLNTKMVSDTLKISEKMVIDAVNFLASVESVEILTGNVKSTRSNPIVLPMLLSATNERTNERERPDRDATAAEPLAEIFEIEEQSEKNLSEFKPQDFRNPQDFVMAGLKKPDDLIAYWNEKLAPKGFPFAPLTLGGTNQDKFFQINSQLRQQGLSWLDYVQRIENSDFLCRRKRGGPPSITWALKDLNFDDVMAGKYDENMSEEEEIKLLKSAGLA